MKYVPPIYGYTRIYVDEMAGEWGLGEAPGHVPYRAVAFEPNAWPTADLYAWETRHGFGYGETSKEMPTDSVHYALFIKE